MHSCSLCCTDNLRTALHLLQSTSKRLKLVLNACKTKFRILSKTHLQNFGNLRISKSDGTLIERVSSCKHLGIWIDENFPFNGHIYNLLKLKIGFCFRNKSCLTFSAKKKTRGSHFSICDR